jgi:DNA-binding response OmpR family regulator
MRALMGDIPGMTERPRILLVDDDPHLRSALAEQMLGAFDPVEASSAAAGLDTAIREHFDAILLDVCLPDMDGMELCRALRQAGVTCPIIMLTGNSGETSTIAGLDSGADDYVTKPFRIGELMARLRAQLRTRAGLEEAEIRIGPHVFQPARRLLIDARSGVRVRLTDKETAILRLLHRAGGAVVSREALRGSIWGYNADVNTHTLETHVYRLRQKLEGDATAATMLLTAPGGYRLATGGG